ncbi:helix-turn-helix domain-containing protein [Planctomycetes bacterium TBK1r]|uniref:Helix-turn-helix domain protein n=1 Tax=Stieleria magnilauensis TaxID=2527963 RepID=A0ABX5Y2M6_9BACT|nr:Helix-turn-helix domain protein [Planctomycetes bacterium TBK1r]
MLKAADLAEPNIVVAVEPVSVSVSDAGAILGVSSRTIETLVARGTLESFRIGNRRLIAVEDIRDYVARQRTLTRKGSPDEN